MRIITLLAVLLIGGGLTAQTTRLVPGSYSTIQAAVSASGLNDIVLVSPGVYNENITISKSLSIVGAQGSATTHIVGGGPGAVIDVDGIFSGNGVTLEGLTIRDGIETGVSISTVANVTIRNCVIENNTGKPGATTPTATPGFAGGIHVGSAQVVIEATTLRGNVGGRGVDSVQSLFAFCSDGTRGGPGALYVSYDSQVDVYGSLFADNVGGAGGDGFNNFCPTSQGAPPHTGGQGGVGGFEAGNFIFFIPFYATVNVSSTTIAGNAGGPGGGGATPGLSGFGGMIPTPPTTIFSSIVWGNPGGSYPPGLAPVATFSNIEGGVVGASNLDVDPQFVDDANGDYHLTGTSPCLDVGDPVASSSLVTDIDGHPRTMNMMPDMGSDEFAPLYPGTGEDFVLSTTLNGTGGDVHVKPATSGDDLVLTVSSPGGTLDYGFPVVILQPFGTGSPPFGVPTIPSLHFDPGFIAVIFNGTNPGFPLPPGGKSFGPVNLLGLLNGFTLRFQALLIHPGAANSHFAVSDANDIQFP